MNVEKWLYENTLSLKGKRVVLTGATGGIGKELCHILLKLGASLILVNRSREKSTALKNELLKSFKDAEIQLVFADMEDIESVKRACDVIEDEKIDFLILNAGAYDIPRHKCKTGFDNVFQINFISQYYMARRLMQKNIGGKVIAVGSIAHNYSRIDETDIDFSKRKKASLVYGNAKRYLMYALDELKSRGELSVSIVHPGITFTGITDHYPKLIFAIIKHPMKIIFMKPKKASLSIVKGIFSDEECGFWIGPSLFDVWGLPNIKKLQTASQKERNFIANQAEIIYRNIH